MINDKHTKPAVQAKKEADSEYIDIETLASASDKKPQKAKKKFKLQVPVIISIAIVLATILGYFTFIAFFLREPEGGVFGRNFLWTNEVDGITYYYEFKDDGTVTIYSGSIEIETRYQKNKDSDGNHLAFNFTGGSAEAYYKSGLATYNITGSRILGNQKLVGSYEAEEEEEFTLTQTNKRPEPLDLPDEFTADEELTGSWVCEYYDFNYGTNVNNKITFNDDGSMKITVVYDGYSTTVTYNGIYTLEDDTVNFTFYVADNEDAQIPYAVKGDNLILNKNTVYTREGSDASQSTADQAQ